MFCFVEMSRARRSSLARTQTDRHTRIRSLARSLAAESSELRGGRALASPSGSASSSLRFSAAASACGLRSSGSSGWIAVWILILSRRRLRLGRADDNGRAEDSESEWDGEIDAGSSESQRAPKGASECLWPASQRASARVFCDFGRRPMQS